jgi:hypothetical protein
MRYGGKLFCKLAMKCLLPCFRPVQYDQPHRGQFASPECHGNAKEACPIYALVADPDRTMRSTGLAFLEPVLPVKASRPGSNAHASDGGDAIGLEGSHATL